MDDEWEVVSNKKQNTRKPKESTIKSNVQEKTSKPLLTQLPGKKKKKSENIIAEKKYNAGTNKQRQTSTSNRLIEETWEDDTKSFKLQTFGALGQKIQAIRASKNLNQTQLANLIHEKSSVVAEIERGDATLNLSILSKIEKALGQKFQ